MRVHTRSVVSAMALGTTILTAIPNPLSALTLPNPASGPRVRGPYQVDPVTVVTTALSVANELNSLFGRKNGPSDQVRAQLRALQQQNAQILSGLSEALDILRNLGLTMRLATRDEIHRSLRDELGAYLRLSPEIRLGETNRRSYEQATYRHREEILVPIARLRTRLTNTSEYGFAHFALIGDAMAVELWTSRRVNEDYALRQARANSYLAFFDQVLSPTTPGSVAAELAAAKSQVARMDTVLAAADSFVRKTPTSIVERNRVLHREPCLTVTYGDVQRTLSGSSETAFSFHDDTVRQHTEPYWTRSCDGGGHPEGGRGATPKNMTKTVTKTVSDKDAFGLVDDESLIPDPDPVLHDQSPASRVTYWNSAIKIRANARAAVAALEVANRMADMFRKRAAEEADEP